jgi:hypothetical protein
MKNLDGLTYPAMWLALGLIGAVGFHSCAKYNYKFNPSDEDTNIEQEKTKQLELQLKLKQVP